MWIHSSRPTEEDGYTTVYIEYILSIFFDAFRTNRYSAELIPQTACLSLDPSTA